MHFKILKNDMRKNPGNNLILLLFMTISAGLVAAVCLFLTQLFLSISGMYETARPPHFLQMHKGEFNQADIDAFNRTFEGIEHWQTVMMLNVSGDNVQVCKRQNASMVKENTYTLEDCRLDISLVKQNETYDVLLDADRRPFEVKKGEIGIPVTLLEQYDISVGDEIVLGETEHAVSLTVAGFIYDAQMNSTLCSSTRFLLSDEDFTALSQQNMEKEYLIEAYFKDSSMTYDYQNAYEESEWNLPKNGQAITYMVMFLLSAMTDILTALVFLFVGVLLIVIAFICLRYIIFAELEDNLKEIGTMKAMGIGQKSIRDINLGKIRILMGTAGILGLFLAFFLQSILCGHLNETFGRQPLSGICFFVAVGVTVLVYLLIISYSKKLLNRTRKVTIADALVTERGFGKGHKVKSRIYRSKKRPLHFLMGLQETKHGYGMIFLLLFVVSSLMLVPCQIVYTMEDKAFVTYMGSPVQDALLEVEQGENLKERGDRAKEFLIKERQQGRVTEYSSLKRVRLLAESGSGDWVGIHIDTGKDAGKGLSYLTGRAPETEQEVALSVLVAEELEKKTGDTLRIKSDDREMEFGISGIYQDITSGGKTAKLRYNFETVEAEKYIFQINLADKKSSKQQIKAWRDALGNGYSIEDMEEFLDQTLGGVTVRIKQAAMLSLGIGVCLMVLIVRLFLKLRFAREKGMLAGKRAMGISYLAICSQEIYPIVCAGGAGVMMGILFSAILGEKVVSAVIQMLGVGITKLEFAVLPFWVYAAFFGILLFLLVGVTRISCRQVKAIRIADAVNV